MDHPQREPIIKEIILPNIDPADYEIFGDDQASAMVRAANSILSWEQVEIIDHLRGLGFDAVEANGDRGSIHIIAFNTSSIRIVSSNN